MQRHLPARAGLALTVVLGMTGPTGAEVVSDPWPRAAVLTRLFTLPAGQPSGAALIKELRLTPAQTQELRRLASSEAALAQQAQRVVGRLNAAELNRKISQFNAEKDRKVRVSLGPHYTDFRQWVRTWWASEVKKAAHSP